MDTSHRADYNQQPLLPSDDNAEKNILGCMMKHDELFTQVEDMINASVFRTKTNQAMFRILKYIIEHRQVADESAIIATAEKFRDRIGVTLDEIRFALMEIGVSGNERTFLQDVERVLNYAMRRKAWETLQKIAMQVVTLTEDADETISNAVKQLDNIRDGTNANDKVVDAKTAIQLVMEQISDNLQGFNRATIKTGFRFSDAKGGFRLGSVIVIGAWTSVGKTALAINISVNVARNNIPVAYYSLEMGAVELWSRIIGSATNISAGKILNYPLRRDETETIYQATEQYADLPIYIDDRATVSFQKMLRSVRTMVKKYEIKMFVVDYLQIFAQNNKSANEEQGLASMARECKNICRELNIACLLLSQLRRDKDERHPTIDMLRGSGQIEESADNILLIDRPDAHPEWNVHSFQNAPNESTRDKAQIRVCKGRNIGLGTYYVSFDANRTQFYEPDGYQIGDEIGYDGQITRPNDAEQQSLPF